MATEPHGISETQGQALKTLGQLRQYTGPAKEFWPQFLAALAEVSGADKVVLLLREGAAGSWKKAGEWPAQLAPSQLVTAFGRQLEVAAEHGVGAGLVLLRLAEGTVRYPNHYLAGVKVATAREDQMCVAVCLLSEMGENAARDSLVRLGLAADVPRDYQRCLSHEQARSDVEKLAIALDVMVEVNAQARFLAAVLAFCNGLAGRLGCERVSLGWLEGGYIRLRAMSRTEKFDRQMTAVSALEAAMEEALDQDEEVVWPADENAAAIARDHERFARDQKINHICSLPLRLEDKAVAALTCERQARPFSALELQQLRLCCEQAVRRLAELKRQDRWLGARAVTAAREHLAKVLGPEHTWIKVLGLVIALFLGILFFPTFNYRVEGNFVLRSEEVSFLTAPFDGYIHQVHVRAGDVVPSGSRLLALDSSQLELEAAAALADVHRYQREAEKARATKNLAEMRIAGAMAEQAQARLDLVRHHLAQAEIKSPFAAVVVEGDLRERIGAPVKQGDALVKVARTGILYVEAEIPEREVHEILQKGGGEIAFVSQPKLKYPVRVATIEPAAVSKSQGNVFLVRCEFERGIQSWWRPGMSGLCKLNAGRRTLFYILTHQTVDFLRLWLWW